MIGQAPLVKKYPASRCWFPASGYWLFLNVARIGLASRQLPEASSQRVTRGWKISLTAATAV
jgi:hypothetical protein